MSKDRAERERAAEAREWRARLTQMVESHRKRHERRRRERAAFQAARSVGLRSRHAARAAKLSGPQTPDSALWTPPKDRGAA